MYKKLFILFFFLIYFKQNYASAAVGTCANSATEVEAKQTQENDQESFDLIVVPDLSPEIIQDKDDLIVRAIALKNAIEIYEKISQASAEQTLVSILALENAIDAASRVIDFYFQHGWQLKGLLKNSMAHTRFNNRFDLFTAFKTVVRYVDKENNDFDKYMHDQFNIVTKQEFSPEQKKVLPIVDLIRAQNKKKIKKLLAQDGTIDLNIEANMFGLFAILTAVLCDDRELVALLMQHKASINIKQQNGFIPLLSATSAQMKQFLRENGADIDFIDGQGRTPLMTAVEKASSFIAQDLLNNGANIHTRGKGGITALHLAFQYSPLIRFQAQRLFLISQSNYARHLILDNLFAEKPNAGKIELGISDDDGVTPFMNAVERGHINWVLVFFKRKYILPIHLNQHDNKGRVPLSIAYEAIAHNCDHNKNDCEHYAMVKALKDAGAHANGLQNQMPPLAIAAENGDEEVVKYLLMAGADHQAVYEGKSAAQRAQQKYTQTGDQKFAKIRQKLVLLENIAEQKQALGKQRQAEKKNQDTLKYLLHAMEEEKREKEERDKQAKRNAVVAKLALLKKEKKEQEENERVQKAKELKEKEEAALKKKRLEEQEALKIEQAEKERIAQEQAALEKAIKYAAKKSAKKDRKSARKIAQKEEAKKAQEESVLKEQQKQLRLEAERQAKKLKDDADIDHISQALLNNAINNALFQAELDDRVMQFKKDQESKNKRNAVEALKSFAETRKAIKNMQNKANIFRKVSTQKDALYALQDHAEDQNEKRALQEKALAMRNFYAKKRAIKALKAESDQANRKFARHLKKDHTKIVPSDHYTNPLIQMLGSEINDLEWMNNHFNMLISQFSYQFLYNRSSYPHSRLIPRCECAICEIVLNKEFMMQSVKGLHWSDLSKAHFIEHSIPGIRASILPSFKSAFKRAKADQKKKEQEMARVSKLNAKAAVFSLKPATK